MNAQFLRRSSHIVHIFSDFVRATEFLLVDEDEWKVDELDEVDDDDDEELLSLLLRLDDELSSDPLWGKGGGGGGASTLRARCL